MILLLRVVSICKKKKNKAKKERSQGHLGPLVQEQTGQSEFSTFGGQKELMEEWEMALEHGEQGRGGRSGSVLVGKVKVMDL